MNFFINKLLYNKFFLKLYFYYKENLQVDFQKNHLLDKLYYSASEETYNYFNNDLKKTFLSLSKKQIREYSIKKSIETSSDSDLYIELGVLNGDSINFFADFLKKNITIYGFDTFEGFSCDWPGSHLQSGFFSRKGILPKKKKNVEFIKGNVLDTLPKFLKNKNKSIKFLHIDLDFYEAATHSLKVAKKYLKKDSYILIDDFANYPGWQNGIFKSLNENFSKIDYEIVAFGVYRSSTILLRLI